MLSSDEVYNYDFGYFEIYKELQNNNGKMGEEIFYHFLNKIFDRPE